MRLNLLKNFQGCLPNQVSHTIPAVRSKRLGKKTVSFDEAVSYSDDKPLKRNINSQKQPLVKKTNFQTVINL